MTRAERLDALLEKAAPKASEYRKKHNTWPKGDGEDTATPEESRAARKSAILADPSREDKSEGSAEKLAATQDNFGRKAPYEIITLKDNRRRVRITNDDGDVIAGVGDTIEDALTALEGKLNAKG